MFTGAPGSACIVHYDAWHHAAANLSNTPRYMHKWLFIRTEEPQRPSWNHAQGFTPAIGAEDDLDSANRSDMWRSLWDWHSALPAANGSDADVPALCAALGDESETVRLTAAYSLARVGEGAVAPLIACLRDESASRLEANLAESMTNPSHLYAGYALSALGAYAVAALERELRSDRWPMRAAAANILGDIGAPAAPAADALAQCLADREPWVRRNAAEALGHMGDAATNAVGRLGDLLADDVAWVQLNAAVALTRIGPAAAEAVPALVNALGDEAYYVRANAAHALDAIGTPAAADALRAYRRMSSDY